MNYFKGLTATMLLLFMTACSAKQSDEEKAVIDYSKTVGFEIKSNDVKNADPVILFCYSNYLWKNAKKDDAVFWYYVAQYRYRFLSSCSENRKAGSYPEEFAKKILLETEAYPKETINGLHLIGGIYRIELYEVIQAQLGQTINGYAYGNLPQMLAMIDRMQTYQNANLFNPTALEPTPVLKSKEIQTEKIEKIKESYINQKKEIETNADYIKEERLKNGLENRK